jgi:1-deoxy-D-xylulose-5-phosphate reductoisomerase
MNKGLELIEAHLLFGVALSSIEVVVHPQSVVHSMVEFVDGSTIAQASPPDMRLPIALGMAWPDRVPDAAPACDWTSAATWEFFPLDDAAFPAVRLARRAAQEGGTAPAVLNAANEQAVSAFRNAGIGFLGISDLVEAVLDAHAAVGLEQADSPTPTPPSGALPGNRVTLEDVMQADAWAREHARALMEEGT